MYAVTLLVLSFRTDAPILSPLVQVVLDLALIAALVYTSGGATSPLRFAFYVRPILAAIRLSPPLAAASTGLALVAYLLVTIPHPSARRPADLHLVVQESLTLIWVGAAAVLLSTLVGRRARRFAELAANRRELVQQSLDAEARERRRLAQVLHDGAIQNVLLARQEVTDLQRGVPEAGERAKAALDETHRQLRDEVFAMHPVGLERAGPEAVLRHFADDAARRGHFQARVRVQPDRRRRPRRPAVRQHPRDPHEHRQARACHARRHRPRGHLRAARAADHRRRGRVRPRAVGAGTGRRPHRTGLGRGAAARRRR